ncbi:MAG: 6-phosphofructokinase [Elusimicrobia bacterium]|nr:6-phosphofructokinase [Elusimicrobiota bacterium]
MSSPSKGRKLRIALSTGGGDAPGLNAVIRAATKTAYHLGWEVYGIQEGVAGLSSVTATGRSAISKVTVRVDGFAGLLPTILLNAVASSDTSFPDPCRGTNSVILISPDSPGFPRGRSTVVRSRPSFQQTHTGLPFLMSL